MSSQFSFKGVATALVTPMLSADGAVDERALRTLVDFQISNGVNGLVPCGTTGESATLNHAEHHHVMDVVVDQSAGRVPVIVGAGSNSTHEAISLTQHARAIGANAVLSIAPYYNKPTQEGFYQHYKAIVGGCRYPDLRLQRAGKNGK